MSGNEKYEGLTITKKDALVISELVTVLVEKLLHKEIEELKEELNTVYLALNKLVEMNDDKNHQIIDEIRKIRTQSTPRQRLNELENIEEQTNRPIRKKNKRADFAKHIDVQRREHEYDPDSDVYDPVADILSEAEEIKSGKRSRSMYDDDDEDMNDIDRMLKITEKLDAMDEEYAAEQKERMRAQLRYEALQEMKGQENIQEQRMESSIEQEQKSFINAFVNEVTGGKSNIKTGIFDNDLENEKQLMDEMFDDESIKESIIGNNGIRNSMSLDYEDEYALPRNMMNSINNTLNGSTDNELNVLDHKARETGFRE